MEVNVQLASFADDGIAGHVFKGQAAVAHVKNAADQGMVGDEDLVLPFPNPVASPLAVILTHGIHPFFSVEFVGFSLG
jgi:hypothetical protein